MTRWAIQLALVLCAVSFTAHAQDSCDESFPARLADAKQALVQFEAFHQGYQKAKPALEWFEAHCRFLEELERVVRKADDPNAFVCDTQKGRPKELTAELVLTYSTLPTFGSYQERSGDNYRCEASDKAARISLVLIDPTPLQRLELACHADEREKCVKARETIAAARAKGAR